MPRGNPKGMKYKVRETTYLSFREISKILSVPVGTVTSDYYRGMKKLKQDGALKGLLEIVHAVAMEEQPILRASSVECDKEFCALHSGEL